MAALPSPEMKTSAIFDRVSINVIVLYLGCKDTTFFSCDDTIISKRVALFLKTEWI